MDFSSRMAALLRQMNRQRNGAVAASMRCYGKPCGLNYGVSLPTVRQIARAEVTDHDFARYLLLQDVRELRLAAFHIADPGRLSPAEFPAWALGIVNSELAEEAAFAFLSRSSVLPELFRAWIVDSDLLLGYAALQAAARSPYASVGWIEPALDAVHRSAEAVEKLHSQTGNFSVPQHAAHLLAQGVVAFLAAFGDKNEENRQAVIRAAGSLGKLPTEDFIHEELAWRLEA